MLREKIKNERRLGCSFNMYYTLNARFKIAMALNWFVMMSSDFESNITSVERVKEYINTPSEVSVMKHLKNLHQTF